MRRHGGVGTFIDVPLVLLRTSATLGERIRVEKRYIRQIGTLNMVGRRDRAPRRARRRRPPKNIRKSTEKRQGTVPLVRPTSYITQAAMEYNDLCQVLQVAYDQDTGKPCDIDVKQGTYDASNKTTLVRRWAETRVMVTFCDDHTIKCTIKEYVQLEKMNHEVKFERVVGIKIIHVWKNVKRGDEDTEKLIQRLSTTARKGKEKLLRGFRYEEVFAVWTRSKGIRHDERRKICQANIQRYARKIWGAPMDYKPVLRVESNTKEVIAAARAGAEILLRRTTTPLAMQRKLSKALRPVRVKPRSISSHLSNWRKKDRDYDPDINPISLCV